MKEGRGQAVVNREKLPDMLGAKGKRREGIQITDKRASKGPVSKRLVCGDENRFDPSTIDHRPLSRAKSQDI